MKDRAFTKESICGVHALDTKIYLYIAPIAIALSPLLLSNISDRREATLWMVSSAMAYAVLVIWIALARRALLARRKNRGFTIWSILAVGAVAGYLKGYLTQVFGMYYGLGSISNESSMLSGLRGVVAWIIIVPFLATFANLIYRLKSQHQDALDSLVLIEATKFGNQDAIKKGLEALPANYPEWGVPYLPIDPKHVGRSYEAVIRVNSQSGKGGVAYIMKAEHGFELPRRLQIEFSKNIQHITEDSGTEISPTIMWEAFQSEYLPEAPTMRLDSHELKSDSASSTTTITAQLEIGGERKTIQGSGNGPIDAFVNGLRSGLSIDIDVLDYAEHAMGSGADATAVAYVESTTTAGEVRWGVGSDPNIITASLRAVLAAAERQQA